MEANMTMVQIIHTSQPTGPKVGVPIPTKHVEFLRELHNQFGDFTIVESSNNEIIILTK